MATIMTRGTSRIALALILVMSLMPGIVPASAAEGAPAPERPLLRGSTVASDVGSPPIEPGKAYVDGELIVRFRPGLPTTAAAAAHTNAGGRAVRSYKIVEGLQRVQLTRGQSVEDAIAKYEAMPDVLYAEPNYMKYATALPNDPRLAEQWAIHNTGQTGGTADADIDAPEAWNRTTGSSDVIIAVIDTGVDYNHPDLAANMWTNTGEIPDNGVDDDHNGYVDDVYGWNAVADNGDPMDDQGHGTHCAGIIGAVGGNGKGIAGVNWDVSIMALKFLDSSGSGSSTDQLECLEYAREMGAHLTSNSYGGWYPFSQAEYDAIAAMDSLFVVAAGNDGLNIDNSWPGGTVGDTYVPANSTWYCYPAAYNLSNILSVGASDHNDARASFSNYGASRVDLFAPGVQILSSVPSGYGLAPDAHYDVVYGTDFSSLSGWTTSDYSIKPWGLSTTSYTSSPSSVAHLGYSDNENAWLDQSTTLNLSGRDHPALRFKWKYDLEEGFDLAGVLITDMGAGTGEWVAATTGTSSGFESVHVDLSKYAGKSIRVSFKLQSDNSVNSSSGYDGVWVDDFQVVDITDFGSGMYEAWNGTSMATPVVAGAAGLLLAQDDSLSWQTLKNMLMQGVDAKSGLSGRCATGGRLNANTSLALATPNSAPVLAPIGNKSVAEGSQLSFTATATDADSDPLTFSLASGAPSGAAITSGGAFTWTPSAAQVGSHTITVRVSDGEAIDSETITVTVVSGQAPTGSMVINNGATYSTTRSLTLNSTVAGATQMRVRASTNGGVTWGSWTTWSPYAASFGVTVGADGVWTYEAEYTNGVSSLVCQDSITVDSIAPSIAVSGVVHGGTYTGTVYPVVTFSGHTTSSLTLDGQPFTSRDAVSALGVHTLVATASDAAGNTAMRTVSFTISEVAPGVETIRVSGASRYQTSVEASKRGFPDGASAVVIATGEDWPDALGGSALAGAVDGPLLLTLPYALPAEVTSEVERLGADTAYILGGTGAVSGAVVSSLQSLGVEVIRIGGASRYETASLVAAEVIGLLGGSYTGDVFVATGRDFPDAAGAAPVAASLGWPIVLANPSTGAVSVPAAATRAVILGGTGAVPASVETALRNGLGWANVQRTGGLTRYDTAAMVAQLGADRGMRWDGVGLATGMSFPDALSGGAMLGRGDSVMLLTRPDSLSDEARLKLIANKASVQTLHIFGGVGAVSSSVESAARAALQ